MLEVTKRRQGQVLKNSDKQLILSWINRLKSKNPDSPMSVIIKEISKATGCSTRTIYKIKTDASNGVSFITNKVRTRLKENKNSMNVKYDSFVKSSVRKIIYDYVVQENPPTINTLLCSVNSKPDLPNFKRATFQTFLKEIGFIYQHKGKRSLLTESKELIESRKAYLKDMRQFRGENRLIIYTGETVVCLEKDDIIKNKTLISSNEPTEKQKCENFQTASETVNPEAINDSESVYETSLLPTVDAAALRSLIMGDNLLPVESKQSANNLQSEEESLQSEDENLLSEEESLQSEEEDLTDENAEIQENSSNTDDISRHITGQNTCEVGIQTSLQKDNNSKSKSKRIKKPVQELRLIIMHAANDRGLIREADFTAVSKKKADDAENFKDWLLERLLPRVPDNSVVVTDCNAPYHKIEENYPDESWTKPEIKNWLLSKNIKVDDTSQKEELLAAANEVRHLYSTNYKINEMAKQKGVIVLSLPQYHYELNPVNMIWARIKEYLMSNIDTFKMKRVKRIIKRSFYSLSKRQWMNYTSHVREMEDFLWIVDEHQERIKALNSTEKNGAE